MEMKNEDTRVLIACSGSVATVKLGELIQQLKQQIPGVQLKAILTEHAQHFHTKNSVPDITYYTDEDEWTKWEIMGDEVLHIELGKWADVMIIAPLSANSLAKVANGLCDNLLTCTLRAWDMSKPVLFAPAMNTKMLEHPITKLHTETLQGWGYEEIPTVEKLLACGDRGYGAMAAVGTIVERVKDALTRRIEMNRTDRDILS